MKGRQSLAVLRLLTLGIEIDAELHVIGDLFTHSMVMHLENNLGSGQHELSAVRAHDLALLSDGPFHE